MQHHSLEHTQQIIETEDRWGICSSEELLWMLGCSMKEDIKPFSVYTHSLILHTFFCLFLVSCLHSWIRVVFVKISLYSLGKSDTALILELHDLPLGTFSTMFQGSTTVYMCRYFTSVFENSIANFQANFLLSSISSLSSLSVEKLMITEVNEQPT